MTVKPIQVRKNGYPAGLEPSDAAITKIADTVRNVFARLDALDKLAERKNPPALKSRRYLDDYLKLLVAARHLREKGDAASLAGIAGMAYSWMPTILKVWPDDRDLVDIAKWALECDSPAFASRSLVQSTRKPAINNSWVGTSKFLHFLAPETFPIWDSVIASIWGLSRYKFEAKDRYAEYIGYVAQLASCEIGPLRKILYPHNPEVSSLRVVEHGLFFSSPSYFEKLKVRERKARSRD